MKLQASVPPEGAKPLETNGIVLPAICSTIQPANELITCDVLSVPKEDVETLFAAALRQYNELLALEASSDTQKEVGKYLDCIEQFKRITLLNCGKNDRSSGD